MHGTRLRYGDAGSGRHFRIGESSIDFDEVCPGRFVHYMLLGNPTLTETTYTPNRFGILRFAE